MELWRGKREDDGKWVFGELEGDRMLVNSLNKEKILINPNSKSRCALQKDINDTTIWEEDIVTWENAEREAQYGRVRVKDEKYVVETVDGNSIQLKLILNGLKVIGNTFESEDILGNINNKEIALNLTSDINMVFVMSNSLRKVVENNDIESIKSKIDNFIELLNNIKLKVASQGISTKAKDILKTGRRVDSQDLVTGIMFKVGDRVFLTNMTENKTYEVDISTLKDVEKEIIMRAKIMSRDEWVSGTHFKNEDGKDFIKNSWDKKEYEVDGDTLGQYTEICDKYGTYIYEGDIITWNSLSAEDDYNNGEVRYENGEAKVYIKQENIYISLSNLKDVENVTNIHDL